MSVWNFYFYLPRELISLFCLIYLRHKYVERALHEKTLKELELRQLEKDDSITPDRMISCLERLISSGIKLKNINLHITHYYSVLADGTVCLPWDWKP